MIQDRPSATRPLWKVEKTVGTTRFGNANGTPPRAVPAEPVLRGEIYGGPLVPGGQACAAVDGYLVTVNQVSAASVPSGVAGAINYLPCVSVMDVSTINPLAVGLLDGHTNINIASGGKCYMHGDLLLIVFPAIDRLTIVDLSDPTNPQMRGSYTHSTNLDDPHFVCAVGNYAYVTCFNRLTTIDISNPNLPVLASTISDSTGLRGAGGIMPTATGSHVIVAAGVGGPFQLRSYTLSTPSTPSFTSSVASGASNGASDMYLALVVDSNKAYVVGNNWFEVYNVSNPAAMTWTGNLNATNIGQNVVLGYTNLALIDSTHLASQSRSGVFNIFNVTTPATPTRVTVDASVWNQLASMLTIIGNRAYVVGPNSNSGDVLVFDISNLSSPSFIDLLHDYAPNDQSLDIDIANSAVWMTSQDGQKHRGRGIAKYDVSDPDVPVLVSLVQEFGGILGTGIRIVIAGSYAFYANTAANAIIAYDISGPTPVFVSSLSASTFPQISDLTDMIIVGTKLYMLSSSLPGLTIIDVSNPASMVVQGSTTTNLASGVLAMLSNGVLAAATVSGRLTLVNVSNPLAPVVISSLQDSLAFPAPRAIAASGTVAHVMSGSLSTGLVSNAQCSSGTPVKLGTYSNTTYLLDAQDMVVRDRYAYVGCHTGSKRITVLDVAPDVPTLVHSVAPNDDHFYPSRLAYENNTLAVLAYESARLYTFTI